jgi:acyl-ACP thioesterase
MGSFLRHPKTTQERRHVECDWACVRPKRRRLPHVWDDLIRGDLGHRNWKRHRLFQWKEYPTP